MSISVQTSVENDVLNKTAAKQIHNKLVKQAKDKVSSDVEFAKLLWFTLNALVQTDNGSKSFHEFQGFDTWNEYIKNQLHFDPRTARQHAQVYQTYFVELKNFKKQNVTDLALMYRVIPLICAENVNDVFSKIKGMSAVDFDRFTKGARDEAGFYITSFRIRTNAKNTIAKGLDMAADIFGDYTEGILLEKIVKDWMRLRKN